MIDPAVERQYSDCKELIAHWRAFHDFFIMGVKGENLTPEKEEQFLELKSRIAMLHDSFMEALSHDHNIGQEVLNIISRAITLKHLSKQSMADIKKMEIEWHESYLLLNDTIGALEDKRDELAKVSGTQYRASKAFGSASQNVHGFFSSGYFKMGLILAVVLFGTVGVQMLGIYDYNNLGKTKFFRAPYQIFKKVYRVTINEDSPWASIEAMNRKPFATWPSGMEKPEVRSDPKEQIIAQIPHPGIQDALNSKTIEYRKEFTRKERGTAEIHTFLLRDAQSARDVKNMWRDFTGTPAGQKLVGPWAVVQDGKTVNGVIFIKSDDPGMTNTIYALVYDQK